MIVDWTQLCLPRQLAVAVLNPLPHWGDLGILRTPSSCLFGLGTRAVAECMVKSSSEETCESARRLLYCMGQANPRFTLTVYKGLVALFSSDLPVVQRMAAGTVRRLQVRSHFFLSKYDAMRNL